MPYALPEASYQQFEQCHKRFLEKNKKKSISKEQKIKYLLQNI